MWNEIAYPYSNFNDAAIEVWEWKSNFITHFTDQAITFPRCRCVRCVRCDLWCCRRTRAGTHPTLPQLWKDSRIQGLKKLLFHEYAKEIFNHHKFNYPNIVLKSISIFISAHNRRKLIIYGVIIEGLETTIKAVAASLWSPGYRIMYGAQFTW